MDFSARLVGPNPQHLLGTDQFGRDLLSRLLVGARSTLLVGLVAVGIACGLGSIIGAVSGYLGGVFDEIVMRLVDVRSEEHTSELQSRGQLVCRRLRATN